MVERHLAKVDVAGSSPVSRFFYGGFWRYSQVVRRWSAKPLSSGSNPDAAFYKYAGVMELVDVADLKSAEILSRVGSSPTLGILYFSSAFINCENWNKSSNGIGKSSAFSMALASAIYDSLKPFSIDIVLYFFFLLFSINNVFL